MATHPAPAMRRTHVPTGLFRHGGATAQHGESSVVHTLLGLQRHIGNQAVTRMLADGQRKADAEVSVQRAPIIQRHSTHEHYLLGTLTPAQLGEIPSIREWRQREQAGDDVEAIHQDRLNETLHVLKQEMQRLLTWQKQSPMQQLARQEGRYRSRIGRVEKVDGEWQVPYVEIPTLGGTTVMCTYGELNTLADMFGNLQDLQKARPQVVVGMLQGVRQRVYLSLLALHREISGGAATSGQPEKRVKSLRPGTSFQGEMGFSGKEKPLLGKVAAIKNYDWATREGGAGSKYPINKGEATASNASAALARNACHFAPETWHTWRRYHDEARRCAQDIQVVKQQLPVGRPRGEAQRIQYRQQTEQCEQQIRDLTNQALLYSGFGDHFLQDAYASGHLIDKTLIMQWMLEWLNNEGQVKWTSDFAMMGSIAKQDLKSNPQMMENVQGGLSDKLAQMNVQNLDHVLFLMWWRRQAAASPRAMTQAELAALASQDADFPLEGRSGEISISIFLHQLLSLGFADFRPKTQRYRLKQEHVNVLDANKKAPYHALTSNSVIAPDYAKEAQEFNYVALNKLMNTSYVQKITNYLHDKFCAEGLVVQDAQGGDIGRIYGDAAMLSAGGQEGVLHSAQTAQMAREAIYDLIAGVPSGTTVPSTQEIEDRFPHRVEVPGGATSISLEEWHVKLKQECLAPDGLFSQGVSGLQSTVVKRAFKSLAHGKPLTPIEQVLKSQGQPRHEIF
jgi:hypothetical protein